MSSDLTNDDAWIQTANSQFETIKAVMDIVVQAMRETKPPDPIVESEAMAYLTKTAATLTDRLIEIHGLCDNCNQQTIKILVAAGLAKPPTI